MSGSSAVAVFPGSPVLIGVKEAAAYLGISRTRLYDKAKHNEIAHVREGQLIYFRKVDLDAWVERKLTRARSAASAATPAADNPLAVLMPRKRRFS
jgi:excisionase family DNA binding protein